jgi:hypothetical protein
MTDIKQAAKWVKEGMEVRRHLWPDKSVLERMDGALGHSEPDTQPHWHKWSRLEIDDLLADDWEIAP